MSQKLSKTTKKPVLIGKEDINFPEFVLGVLDNRGNKTESKEIIFQDPKYPDKKIGIVRSGYGFPTQLTRDLYRALMRLTYTKGHFQDRKVKCTLREICREMGIAVGGKTTTKIKESLDILTQTRVKFYYSYFDLEEKEVIDSITSIGILDTYTLREFNKKGDKKNSDTLENSIGWSIDFWDLSLKEAKNLINYDYSFYIALKGNITKELYVFLNKRAFNKKFFKIPLSVLAFEKLGMSRTLTDKLFKVRQQLRKAHQELLEKGFFDSEPLFVKTSDEEWIHYSFAVRHKFVEDKEPAFLEQTLLVFDEHQEKIKNELKQIDFTEGQIGKILDQHETQFLQDGLDLLAITESIKNPRNWFWGYLKGRYDITTLHQKRKEEEKLLERRRQEEIKQKQIEQEERIRLEILKKEEEEKAKQSANQNNLINDWIIKNPMQWVEMCKNYLENDFKGDNSFFYERLIKDSQKQEKTPLEVFMATDIYNYKMRSMVWQIVEGEKQVL